MNRGGRISSVVGDKLRKQTRKMRMSIEVEGLSKVFSGRPAVDDITFTAGPGRVTGFLGPNGAGKSTTMRMILGLIHPTSGRATVLGRPYRELEAPDRSVGAVLDTAQFHPARTGMNHLRVLATVMHKVERSRIPEVLELVQLRDEANKKVGAYSLGMKQRLGIAAALLGSPEVLILDEPANGLDPAGMRWLRGFLRQLAGEGKTVLVSSHLLDEISHMAHEVIVINRGQLVTQSSVEELLRRASSGSRVNTPQPERLRDALAARGIDVTLAAHDQLVVGAPPESVGHIALAAGIPVTGLNEEQQSLEDVFLELTQRA
jgi:ABC-2 type transport system ATP-binding protein